jgi:ribose transport system substrate-binding protein
MYDTQGLLSQADRARFQEALGYITRQDSHKSDSMKAFERRQEILNVLRKRHTLKVTELAESFGVSQGTIRSDLDYLSQTEQVTRIRGGATLLDGHHISDPEFAARVRVNSSAKQCIARWAADIVKDGDAIFLDASTTAFHMVPFLQDHQKLTVITYGIETALALAKNPSFTVILMGGIVRPGSVAITGQLSEQALEGLHIRTAFVSAAGLSVEAGLTDPDIQVAQLKSKVVQSAGHVIALVDSNKFGNVELSSFATLGRTSQVLTDDNLDAKYIDQLQKTGTVLTVCGQSATSAYAPVDEEVVHYKIGFANLGENRPFALEVRRGLEEAAQQVGHIDLVLADNKHDNRVALEVADYLIRSGVDIAIEYHYDEKTGSLISDKFKQACIPVIAVDTSMIGATFFGVDNYRAGRDGGIVLGNWIKQNWDGKIDRLIALEYTMGGPLPAARITGQIDGLQEVIGEIPPSRIISVDDKDIPTDTEAHVARILESLPDEHRLAIVSLSDMYTAEIISVARKADREQDVVCVALGAGTRLTRSEVRHPGSSVVAAVAFRPEKYGEQLIELAQRLIRREPVPPAVYIDHVVLDASNINSFYPEY